MTSLLLGQKIWALPPTAVTTTFDKNDARKWRRNVTVKVKQPPSSSRWDQHGGEEIPVACMNSVWTSIQQNKPEVAKLIRRRKWQGLDCSVTGLGLLSSQFRNRHQGLSSYTQLFKTSYTRIFRHNLHTDIYRLLHTQLFKHPYTQIFRHNLHTDILHSYTPI